MAQKFTLKLTGGIAVAGKVYRPGDEVTLDDREARNLLARGKAELLGPLVDEEATGDDGATDSDDATGEDDATGAQPATSARAASKAPRQASRRS